MNFGFTKRQVKMIEVIVLLNAMALSILLPTAQSTGEITTPQGVWTSFPTSTQCPFSPQVSLSIPDSCEFMFSTNFRRLDLNPGTPFLVQLIVHCSIPSNTAGAFLVLQVANYSLTTGTNSSNFIDGFGGHQVAYLDNALGHPNGNGKCPGDIPAGTFSTMPPLGTNSGWVFRIAGSSGGGIGDNPKFTTVSIETSTQGNRLIQATATAITANGFTAFMYMLYSPATATTVNFDWMATNVTASSCINLNVCIQHGSGSCSIPNTNFPRCSVPITFGTAFSVAPDVTVTSKTGAVFVSVPSGFIDLFQTQPS